MPQPLLATKTFVPRRRPQLVPRQRLHARLADPQRHRLTLVCAPAGFGKTTLLVDWITASSVPAAWLSLEPADADPGRFLAYLVAAVRTVVPDAGADVLAMLGAPQPPPIDVAMTSLVNDLAAADTDIVLVLDDLHAVDSPQVDAAVAFLVESLPECVRLVIATREDPAIPLGRLRARGELLELRAADLRFTTDESAAFLEGAMGLVLDRPDVSALDAATEGWAAGLQLAAVAVRGRADPGDFIRSFSGSHRFVLDYLVEEVLDRQTPAVSRFLLDTSILDEMCGPLCDAVTADGATLGQATLEELDRANLFIVALDDERRWFRYHHLFRDLLRQRLGQAASQAEIDERHIRASRWYEENGLDVQAFEHASEGHDLDRAERLIEGDGLPLYVRGALMPILSWLSRLPPEVFHERPRLRATHATVLLASGFTDGVAEMLDQAEAEVAVRGGERAKRDIANIAITRSLLGLSQHRADVMIAESERALALLPDDALVARSTVLSTLGYAYEVLGERAPARDAYRRALTMSRAVENRFGEMASLIGLAGLQELANELRAAVTTYREAIARAADLQYPVISEAYLGLGRIAYEQNDLAHAREFALRSLELGRRLQHTDRPIASQILLARIALAEGDRRTAWQILREMEAAEGSPTREAPRVAVLRVQLLLGEDRVAEAWSVVAAQDIPLAAARVRLAEHDPRAALAVLEPFRQRAEACGFEDERIRALVLEALAHDAVGAPEHAGAVFAQAARIAEPEGFVRLFLDEMPTMGRLLRRLLPGPDGTFAGRLLGLAREAQVVSTDEVSARQKNAVEPLTPREIELVSLIAEGLTNAQIAERLYLSPHTVKVHTRNIYGKLGATSRAQAVALARRLGVLDAR